MVLLAWWSCDARAFLREAVKVSNHLNLAVECKQIAEFSLPSSEPLWFNEKVLTRPAEGTGRRRFRRDKRLSQVDIADWKMPVSNRKVIDELD